MLIMGCGDGCEMGILDIGDSWWFGGDIDFAMGESMVGEEGECRFLLKKCG